MNINYQTVTLYIVSKGKIIKLFSDSLKNIDDITRKQISKFALLKYLLNSSLITNNISTVLDSINEDIPDGLLYGDEYKSFDFFLTLKDNTKTICIPIIYNEYSFDRESIYQELNGSNNLIQILNMYTPYEYGNVNNLEIIDKILYSERAISKNNVTSDELFMLEDFDQSKSNGKRLNDKDYDYYKSLKSLLYSINERSKLLNKLVSNLQSSYYKTRSLCMIKKYINDELSEFDSIILTASDKTYDALEHVLSECTLKEKQLYNE